MIRAAAVLLALLCAAPAQAAERFGDFVVFESDRYAIALDGSIDETTVADFKRAMAERPSAQVVLLQSLGGEVGAALALAEEIGKRGLSTAIPRDLACYSACAYVFFAGRDHVVEGRLGVHQISAPGEGALGGAVAFYNRVKGELERIGVPAGVIRAMLKTRPDDIHVFSRAEIAAMAINRSSGEDSLAAKYAAANGPET
jgi:hypothetical protein